MRIQWGKKYVRVTSILPEKFNLFLIISIICLALIIGMVGQVSGDANTSVSTNPVVTIIDVTATIDVSQIGEIPLGQTPDERLYLTITLANNENQPISGLRIRSYLVKEGRENSISAQLGSDFRNVELKPGEIYTFKNNYMISKKLSPGPYKVMVRVDSDVTSESQNSDSIEFISNKVIKIAAYADAKGGVPVYSPAKIDTPGSYFLMRDIQGGKRDNIFRITTSKVSIDGGGHTIRGLSNGYTAGIYVDGQTNLEDITIKNCVLEGIDFGVWFYRVSNGRVINCTFKDCTNIGLRLDQSRTNTVSENTFTGNELGIGIFQSSGNTISNNYFKSKFNAAVNEGQRNSWSVEPHTGVNIIGGPVIAGNAWFEMDGKGYSVTTPDTDHDGVADNPYTINGDNIDYYPLSEPSVSSESSIVQPMADELLKPIPDTDSIADNNLILEEISEVLPSADIENSADTEEKATINQTIPSYDIADLAIREILIPEVTCISENVPIETTIENLGTLEAESFSLHYFLSEKTGITPSDTDIGSHFIESLKPQENLTIKDDIKIPSETGMKLYTLGAIVDPAKDIYEDDTTNNYKVANHPIQIKDC
jgi:parallel beta-helix repeat protein